LQSVASIDRLIEQMQHDGVITTILPEPARKFGPNHPANLI